jgi:DNA-binding NarL/FixJ family response regulator
MRNRVAESWFPSSDSLHTSFAIFQTNPAEQRAAVSLTARAQLSVLVVDDSHDVRSALRALIDQEQQLRVVGAASNASDAINLFLHYRPDLVLLSITLPDASGFHVLDCIKRTCPYTTVILMTKLPNPCVEESGRLLGATEVCPKTARFDEIRTAISRFVQMRFPKPG